KSVEKSVKVDRILDVKRGQESEHEGLDRADQQLERVDPDHEHEAQHGDRPAERAAVDPGIEALHDEVAEYLEQDVPGKHRHEWPQPEAERPHEERDELDRRE